MNSNLKKYYTNKGLLFSLIDSKGELFNPNPFCLVNNFLSDNFKDKNATLNYYNNLLHLNISEEQEKGYLFDYDPDSNTIISKNTKSDIYALIHIASVDKYKKEIGIISDNKGYGLNTGINELYAKKISGCKESFPLETTVAEVLDKIDRDALGEAYFCNNNTDLIKLIGEDNYSKLLKLVDIYHDTYILLHNLYNEKFAIERYYFNSIYGRDLKKNNVRLIEIDTKIEHLEYYNYTVTYDIIHLLTNIISECNFLEDNIKLKYLDKLEKKLNKIFSKPEFMYLNDLSNEVSKNNSVNKLVKKK